MNRKGGKFLKWFLFLIGGVLILSSLIDSRLAIGERITVGCIGGLVCILVAFRSAREILMAIFSYGIVITNISSIWSADGKIDAPSLILILAFLVIGVFFSWKTIRRIHFNAISKIDLTEIDCMTGLEFESFTAELLKKHGYVNVTVTKASGDQGIDVLAQREGVRYAIQCKRYTHELDNTPVQEAYAGKQFYGCDVGVVITNSTFTDSARQLADAVGILLWDRKVLQEMIYCANRKHLPKKALKGASLSESSLTSPDDIVVTTNEDLQNFLSSHTLIDTIHTKAVGVTFNNQDGTSRQDILALCSGGDAVGLKYFDYHGSPAYAVISQYGQIGNLSADLAEVIDSTYDGTVVRCTISAVTGGSSNHHYGCNLRIEVFKENVAAETQCTKQPRQKPSPGITTTRRKRQQPSVSNSFIAQAQWYAARGGEDLIDDE